ncbi:hypothetical protein TRFO_27745 [Tritrichomonas foetus]|uniref:Uncharacterized protein n=1 Tax=Tritrichomonas foetus TaxID=1144522 RepID=A0A1J4JZS6_9EUKA|nr:hypothetical protein TRFO_27745 [Tritrichomonas foetus]|eukprot:OHT04671.1 hypothetical protein TRFO_27745 [Tritrichomonas foetus]
MSLLSFDSQSNLDPTTNLQCMNLNTILAKQSSQLLLQKYHILNFFASKIDEMIEIACGKEINKNTDRAMAILTSGSSIIIESIIESNQKTQFFHVFFEELKNRVTDQSEFLTDIDNRLPRILSLLQKVILIRPNSLSNGFQFIIEIFELIRDVYITDFFENICGPNQPPGITHHWLIQNGFQNIILKKLKNGNDSEIINIIKVLKVCSHSDDFDPIFTSETFSILISKSSSLDIKNTQNSKLKISETRQKEFFDELFELFFLMFDFLHTQLKFDIYSLTKHFIFNNFCEARRAEVAAIKILAKFAETGKVALEISPVLSYLIFNKSKSTFLMNAIVDFASSAFSIQKHGCQVAVDLIPSLIRLSNDRKSIHSSECAFKIVSAAKEEAIFDPELKYILSKIHGLNEYEKNVMKKRNDAENSEEL